MYEFHQFSAPNYSIAKEMSSHNFVDIYYISTYMCGIKLIENRLKIAFV